MTVLVAVRLVYFKHFMCNINIYKYVFSSILGNSVYVEQYDDCKKYSRFKLKNISATLRTLAKQQCLPLFKNKVF